MSRVAVVTGANKGIGLAVVQALAKVFPGDVILTSRSPELGLSAASSLSSSSSSSSSSDGSHSRVIFHRLDVTDEASVRDLALFIREEYGGLDVLVNNAAIAFGNNATEPFGVQITLATNFWSLKLVCDVLFPLLRPGARVVNVSSEAGRLNRIKGGHELEWSSIKQRLGDPDLSLKTLEDIMRDFEQAAKDGNHTEKGYPSTAYGMSKVGVSALTRVQQRLFDSSSTTQDLSVNHVHPGDVDTDMTGHKGPLSTREGARSAVFAATLPPGTDVRGKFIWEDCSVRDWVND